VAAVLLPQTTSIAEEEGDGDGGAGGGGGGHGAGEPDWSSF
jgi:hypothetical protein